MALKNNEEEFYLLLQKVNDMLSNENATYKAVFIVWFLLSKKWKRRKKSHNLLKIYSKIICLFKSFLVITLNYGITDNINFLPLDVLNFVSYTHTCSNIYTYIHIYVYMKQNSELPKKKIKMTRYPIIIKLLNIKHSHIYIYVYVYNFYHQNKVLKTTLSSDPRPCKRGSWAL